MVARKNNIGTLVVMVPAVVKEIKPKVHSLTNKDGEKTEYQLGLAEITYPDGGKEDVLTRFYAKSIAKHSNVFTKDGKISLEIQAEGEYAGRAVAKLPGNTADVSRLLGNATVKVAEPTVEEEPKVVV
jgi:hypothetical protein